MVVEFLAKRDHHLRRRRTALRRILPLKLRERWLTQRMKHVLEIVRLTELRQKARPMVSSQCPHQRVAMLAADAAKQRPVTPIQSRLLHFTCS